jgi:hypothetical protein
MHPYYGDILSRIDAEPIWFDEHAVPRFCEFSPEQSASIYVDECALAEISCQACKRPFRVAFSAMNVKAEREMSKEEWQAFLSDSARAHENIRPVADAIRNGKLHYGDPPNVQCCDAGPSMNSIPLRVVEYWSRLDRKYVKDGRVTDLRFLNWERDPSLEIGITADWAAGFGR